MTRFEKILCPVDFFPASLQAFDYALRLAANYGARVEALHVVAPVVPSAYGAPFDAGELMVDLERESKRMIAKLKAKGEKAGVPTEGQVRIGDIDLEIRRIVDAGQADLVLMGSHGRRGFERWVMGSVAERMIRHCAVPLMVVGHASPKRSLPPKIKRILVTTDFSAGTADALGYAFSVAQECQAHVTLLHVVADLSAEVGSQLTQPLMESVRERLEALIPDGVRDWCEVETRVAVGEPYRVITEAVETGKPGLLVMNIHGKGMIERALLGSTAERVLRSVLETCPVMLVPPLTQRKLVRRAS